MFVVISILMLIASVLMVLVVLVQNSKGGGLASNFSSSNQIMGVRQTADFLEKATWTMAVAMLVLSLGASIEIPKYNAETSQSSNKLPQPNEQTTPVDFQAPPVNPDEE